MALTTFVYPNFMLGVFENNIAITDTYKLALVTGLSFSSGHTAWSDVSAAEISASGYTAGGQALTSATYNLFFSVIQFTSATAIWTSASEGAITAGAAVLYDDTSTSPTDALVALIDFGGSQTASAGYTFELAPSGAGWFVVQPTS